MSGSEVERFELEWDGSGWGWWRHRSAPFFSVCAKELDKRFDLPRGPITACVSRRAVRCPNVAVLETGSPCDWLDGEKVTLTLCALRALGALDKSRKFWVWFEYEEQP